MSQTNPIQRTLTARVKGGLGNQLFIYASLRGLAERHNYIPFLDSTSGYINDRFGRVYLLDQFKIKVPQSNCFKRYTNQFGRFFRTSERLMNKYLPQQNRWYLDEEAHGFYESLNGFTSNDIYLDGYWQSDSYFNHLSREIRDELTTTGAVSDAVLQQCKEIQNCESVIIGVRRFEEMKGSLHVPLIDPSFYKNAIEIISSKISNPSFYIVTEHTEWAKNNLPAGYRYKYIPHIEANERAHENLYLMKNAKHYIISNSTYHWWGAWLGENTGKIVICPRNGWIHAKPFPSDWFSL